MRPLAVALLLSLAHLARADAPLTLDEALAIAARANADLALARADASGSAADRTAAFAGVLPRLDLSSAFGHSFVGRSSFATTFLDPITNQVRTTGDAFDTEAYSLGLQLSQPIFDWGAWKEIERARAGARAAERQYDEATLTVAFEVTRRFYELVKAERSLGVLEKTAARSEELVARADALYVAGRAPKADTLSARVNLQNDRIAVEGQRVRVAQARSALAQALGRTDPTGVMVVAPASVDGPVLPAGEPPALDALLARARSARPAVAAESARVEAARAGVGSAQSGYLPAVGAQASYGRQGATLAGSGGVWGDPTRDYQATAQVVLSWNLFEGRRTSAGVQRASSGLERARASEDRTAQSVSKEVADAREAVIVLARQVTMSSDVLGTAQQALKLATERLEAGLANQLDLRDASLKLTQAELSLLESRIDHAVAVADLTRAVGGVL
jgi:outer membrane protein